MRTTSARPSLERPGDSRLDKVRVSSADILTIARNVGRVYENVQLLADEGIVEFDVLDLRPSLAILDELIREPPR